MPEPTLEFVAAQLSRVIDEQRDFREEMRSFRDEMRTFREDMVEMREQMVVLTGMVLRLDGSVTALLAQGRLYERRTARLETRVAALEEARD